MGRLPVTAAVVHPDGAIVTRRGVLPVENGVVAITGLPLLLDEGSLRVQLDRGIARELRVDLDVAGEDRGDLPDAVTRLWEAQQTRRRVDQELRLVEHQRGLIAGISPPQPDDVPEDTAPPTPARIRGWAQLSAPLQAWSEHLTIRAGALRRQLENEREAVRLAKSAVQRLSPEAWWKHWRPIRVAHLAVDGDVAETEIALTYRVEGAVWTPAYTLHTDPLYSGGELVLRALVAQATGEDWTGVRLRLSTAPCSRRVDLPKLPSMRLGIAQPTAESGWRPLPKGLDALFPPELSIAPPSPKGRPPEPEEEMPTMEEEVDMLMDMDDMPLPPPAMAPVAAAPAPQQRASASSFFSLPQPSSFGGRAGGAPGGEGPKRRRKSKSKRRNKPTPPPLPAGVEAGALEYPRLRMASFDQPVGVRGRLQPSGVDEEAREASVPNAGVAALQAARSGSLSAALGLRSITLPPHHVLPGPIDGADYCYTCTGDADVRADGRLHAVSVRSVTLSMTPTYRSVPREDPRAFRRVLARSAEAIPFLPGPLDVLVEGELVLALGWRGGPAGAEVELSLGVEDRLEVARNVRHTEESAGLLGGSRRLYTTVEVEIASSLPRDAVVEVLDRVPITDDDDITIVLEQSVPNAMKYEGEPDGTPLEGGKLQRVGVSAGGKAKATLQYSVTIGARQELVGGDRRG